MRQRLLNYVVNDEGQKRDRIYHSVFKFIHEKAAAVHGVRSSLEVAMTETNLMVEQQQVGVLAGMPAGYVTPS